MTDVVSSMGALGCARHAGITPGNTRDTYQMRSDRNTALSGQFYDSENTVV